MILSSTTSPVLNGSSDWMRQPPYDKSATRMSESRLGPSANPRNSTDRRSARVMKVFVPMLTPNGFDGLYHQGEVSAATQNALSQIRTANCRGRRAQSQLSVVWKI